jgi:hypothetical protein
MITSTRPHKTPLTSENLRRNHITEVSLQTKNFLLVVHISKLPGFTYVSHGTYNNFRNIDFLWRVERYCGPKWRLHERKQSKLNIGQFVVRMNGSGAAPPHRTAASLKSQICSFSDKRFHTFFILHVYGLRLAVLFRLCRGRLLQWFQIPDVL